MEEVVPMWHGRASPSRPRKFLATFAFQLLIVTVQHACSPFQRTLDPEEALSPRRHPPVPFRLEGSKARLTWKLDQLGGKTFWCYGFGFRLGRGLMQRLSE